MVQLRKSKSGLKWMGPFFPSSATERNFQTLDKENLKRNIKIVASIPTSEMEPCSWANVKMREDGWKVTGFDYISDQWTLTNDAVDAGNTLEQYPDWTGTIVFCHPDANDEEEVVDEENENGNESDDGKDDDDRKEDDKDKDNAEDPEDKKDEREEEKGKDDFLPDFEEPGLGSLEESSEQLGRTNESHESTPTDQEKTGIAPADEPREEDSLHDEPQAFVVTTPVKLVPRNSPGKRNNNP